MNVSDVLPFDPTHNGHILAALDGYDWEDRVVTTPGKFEGQPIEALHADYARRTFAGTVEKSWDFGCSETGNVDLYELIYVSMLDGELGLLHDDDQGNVTLISQSSRDLYATMHDLDRELSTRDLDVDKHSYYWANDDQLPYIG